MATGQRIQTLVDGPFFSLLEICGDKAKLEAFFIEKFKNLLNILQEI